MKRFLQIFWDEQAAVPKARRFYGWMSRTERGVTQGGPFYPKIFNIVVD